VKRAILVMGVLVLFLGTTAAAKLSCRDPAATQILQELYVQLIPFPGTSTSYGIPISLWNVGRFRSWNNTIALSPQEERVMRQALADLPVPPCGHASILECCRRPDRELEKVCELVRSAVGLAKWLVHVKHFGAEEVRSAVDQWLHFVFSSYYLASALAARGIDPVACGLPVVGTCVRGQYGSVGGPGGCEVVGMKEAKAKGGGG